MITATKSIIENLANKVREIAGARPETVYRPAPTGQVYPATQCSYLGGTCSDGTVGCLVGQALLGVGFTVEKLRPVDLVGIEETLEKLLPCEFTNAEYHEIRWLQAVQDAQDNGHPWGEAIQVADEEVPL